MSNRRALVLGITGMVGAALARALQSEGWQVFGAARGSDPATALKLAEEDIEVMQFDVMADDPGILPDVNVVFLEIWDPSRPELTWDISFYGVGRVVERYAGQADFVNGSTINVYGAGPTFPNEDAPCRPDSEYGRSRFAQERLIDYFCYCSGSRGIRVRYAHANTAERGKVRRIAEAILAGDSLGTNPDGKTQVIALEDFVRITVAALQKVETRPIAVNCCHPKVWTERELAAEIHRRLGKGTVVFERGSRAIRCRGSISHGEMVWSAPRTR
ncbi:MAG: NAD-dependent epimerase/dehydratase family protein [Candidatus Hydrogenedentes bacterium]|nr:NAD-dependent epimerase/dehydratase family protein [Candidatus Hydrogenedentota bacterium]